jgi:hypothetical protein
MIALFCLCLALFVSPFKSKTRLEAENVALRHQLIILRRKVRGRIRVCTENSIRVDHVSESLNLRGDDRSLLPLPGPVRLVIQVERPT